MAKERTSSPGEGDADDASRNAQALMAGEPLPGEGDEPSGEAVREQMLQEAREGTERDVARSSQPDGSPAHVDEQPQQPRPEEPDEGEEREGKLAGKFDTVEELEEAYRKQNSEVGRKSNEIGDLRRTVDELRGRTEAHEAILSGKRPEGGEDDPRQQAFDRLVARKAAVFKRRLSLNDQEALEMAREDVQVTGELLDVAVEPVLEPVKNLTEREKQAQALAQGAQELRDEKDPETGKPMRPEWNEVVNSPEMQELYTERPELFDPTNRVGLEYAYELARERRTSRLAQESSDTEERVLREEVIQKRKGSMAPAAGTEAGGGSPPDPDEAERDAIYSSGRRRHPLMGGSIKYG